MSWSLKKKSQALLADEQGTVIKDWGGKISVALVYPNTYAVGMSNLGFQTIYQHLNAIPDVVCERVFMPEPADLDEMRRASMAPFSLESLRPLTDFHLVGFSVTYEGDYVNVLRLLAMAGIPPRASARRPHDPLVLMGGVCAFSNPEPIAPFMDFVVVGEGEELVVELIAAYREGYREREALLTSLTTLDGIYVPGRYDAAYGADGTLAAVAARDGAPEVVVKRRLRNVNAFETVAAVKTPHAEYGHMALLEVGKGCGRGCRFCLEGQVYRPVRHRSVDALRETVAQMAANGERRVGLVGACVSDYPWIGELLKIVEENGLELSISSLRADSLTEDLVAALARGGHRTLTMAPEAGTARRRSGPSSRPSSAACGACTTCAYCTRTRARRRCRRCWLAATGGSRISWSWRPRTKATGGARSASGTATPTSTRPASAPPTSGCRGITSTSASRRPVSCASGSGRGPRTPWRPERSRRPRPERVDESR